jgi:hypothetical protein
LRGEISISELCSVCRQEKWDSLGV